MPPIVDDKPRKLAIICSKGTLDMAYPGLILANAARMSGVDAMIFFTFWGLDIVTKSKSANLKVATVGNPSMGMPTFVGAIPGMSAMGTSMMKKEIAKLDLPTIPEMIQMLDDAGCELYGCKMACDMMKLTKDDLVPQIREIISAMDFIEKSEGAQTIFI